MHIAAWNRVPGMSQHFSELGVRQLEATRAAGAGNGSRGTSQSVSFPDSGVGAGVGAGGAWRFGARSEQRQPPSSQQQSSPQKHVTSTGLGAERACLKAWPASSIG
jgi:hypothetical protein